MVIEDVNRGPLGRNIKQGRYEAPHVRHRMSSLKMNQNSASKLFAAILDATERSASPTL
jgi:hypothetical protein